MKMNNIVIHPSKNTDFSAVIEYLRKECIEFSVSEGFITIAVPSERAKQYIEYIERDVNASFSISTISNIESLHDKVIKQVLNEENKKRSFICSPNTFKVSYYAGNEIYVLSGNYSVKVTKENLNKSLKQCDYVEGFTLDNHPGYVFIRALL